jgi:hypothetical protein
MPFDGKEFALPLSALDKMDQVIDLLSREERWCKGKLYTDDGRRCIVGALQEVEAAVELSTPIMLAIEQVVGAHFSGIEAFNDNRATNHAMVVAVLRQARTNVLAGVVGEPAPVMRHFGGLAGWRQRLAAWAGAKA